MKRIYIAIALTSMILYSCNVVDINYEEESIKLDELNDIIINPSVSIKHVHMWMIENSELIESKDFEKKLSSALKRNKTKNFNILGLKDDHLEQRGTPCFDKYAEARSRAVVFYYFCVFAGINLDATIYEAYFDDPIGGCESQVETLNEIAFQSLRDCVG